MVLGKILKTIGVEAEEVPTEQEAQRADRHGRIILGWRYLRTMLDQGIAEYFESGDTTKIEKAAVDPARARLLEQLDVLRSQGRTWSFPERDRRASAQVEVINEVLDDRGWPASFVVREIFHDNSVLTQLDTNGNAVSQLQADGNRRIFEAQVVCPGHLEYYLQDVRQIQLGD